MTTDILIKTCQHDTDYHEYCIKSIEKFCSGFRNTVVIDGEHPRGYLHQQVVKMNADLHTDADMILVTDSDTLFTEPVAPESFMRDGKPIWFVTPWNEAMMANRGTRAWHEVMSQFFGQNPPYEFMRRQPFMFPREVLVGLRDFCAIKHGVSLEEYIMKAGRFSEWNVLGFFCWLHHREKFYWMDTTVECPPPLVRQFWSHDPIGKNIEEINRILA